MKIKYPFIFKQYNENIKNINLLECEEGDLIKNGHNIYAKCEGRLILIASDTFDIKPLMELIKKIKNNNTDRYINYTTQDNRSIAAKVIDYYIDPYDTYLYIHIKESSEENIKENEEFFDFKDIFDWYTDNNSFIISEEDKEIPIHIIKMTMMKSDDEYSLCIKFNKEV